MDVNGSGQSKTPDPLNWLPTFSHLSLLLDPLCNQQQNLLMVRQKLQMCLAHARKKWRAFKHKIVVKSQTNPGIYFLKAGLAAISFGVMHTLKWQSAHSPSPLRAVFVAAPHPPPPPKWDILRHTVTSRGDGQLDTPWQSS
jgi:hypothetical protein